MHPPISQRDLVAILDEADAAAMRLRRRLRLAHLEFDDLRQDLLLDLIRRLPAFDARRGSIRAFAGIVLRNQACRIAARVNRDRRETSGRLLPLEAAGDGAMFADGLGEVEHSGAALEAVIAARVDVARALGTLQAHDRRFCAAAAHASVDALVERGLGSRATLYRRLRDLRCVLAAHGAWAA